MAGFLDTPELAWVGGERPWELHAPARYVTDVIAPPRPNVIEVPESYRTDLASVPRIPVVYWRVGNRAVLAAVIHDWLWCNDQLPYSAAEVDRIFLEAMRVTQDPPREAARLAMYAGVRIGRLWWWLRDRVQRAAAGVTMRGGDGRR